MDLSRHIDLQCERVGFDFFAEPLNLFSNITFLISAYFLWRSLKEHSLPLYLLIFSGALIGIGSAMFHSISTMWSALCDILPIIFFLSVYIIMFARRVLGWNRLLSWGLFFALLGLNIGYKFISTRGPDGYVSYLPSLVFFCMLTFALWLSKNKAALPFTLALCLAGLSFLFRTIDMLLCDQFPIGTHFLWHILNAGVLYILTRTVIEHKKLS